MFKSGNELVRLVLNRKNKKAFISSSKTNYSLQPVAWSMLFDKGKERLQEKITDKLSDEDFTKVISSSMMQQGYIPLKNEQRNNSIQ